MNPLKKIEIKVGLVTLAAVALLIFGITWGKGFKSVGMQTLVKFQFPNSAGLQISAPVFVNGVMRGTVVSIDNRYGAVLITANLDNIADLKSDAAARISILEITGGKKIDIFPGVSNLKFNSSNLISGATSADISELIAIGGDVASEGKRIIRKLDTIVSAVAGLLGNSEFLAKLGRSVDNFDKISASLESSLCDRDGSLFAAIDNLKRLSQQLRVFADNNAPKLELLLDKLDRAVADVQTLASSAGKTIARSDTLLGNLNEISSKIDHGSGLAAKLINDGQLPARLDSTLEELDRLLIQIREYGINTNVRLGSRP